MHEAVDDVIQRRRLDPGGLSRALSASVTVHVLAVVLLFVFPKAWLAEEKAEPLRMTISLGGSPGERSGGLVSAGASPIEKVAPPPKRPEPQPPATPPRADVITVPVRPPPKTPRPPATSAADPAAAVRPPTTGAQVRPGTAVAETRITGPGTGQATGGGTSGARAATDADFCCKDYLEEVVRRIEVRWNRAVPETGETIVVFEILKDGSFGKPEVERKSGSILLDTAAMSAFNGVKFPPLPPQYPGDRLKIHLTFPYVR